jgi:predicted nucleotidyltransferase
VGTGVIDLITDNLEAIRNLCRTYGVRRMYVFGSAAAGEFRPGESDVDFIVQWLDLEHRPGFHVVDLVLALEDLLGVHVDVLTADFVKNPYMRRSILEQRVKIYESEGREEAA